MARGRGFTLIELLVVVAVIAVLIAILLPSLSKSRKLARGTVCETNERALVAAYRVYFQEYQVVLSSPGHVGPGAWDYLLLGGNTAQLDYYTNNGLGPVKDRPRFCPETTTERRAGRTTVGTSTLAWDCHSGPGGGSTGSYAMNNYLYNGTIALSRGPRPASTSYYTLKSANTDHSMPVFVDAAWHDILPRPTDQPGSNLDDPEAGTSADRNLGDAALNRHDKAVNVSFWDEHVERVQLQKLWTLKWSADWQPPASLPVIPN